MAFLVLSRKGFPRVSWYLCGSQFPFLYFRGLSTPVLGHRGNHMPQGLEVNSSLYLVKYFFHRIVQDWAAILVVRCWFEAALTYIDYRMNLEHQWYKHWFSTIYILTMNQLSAYITKGQWEYLQESFDPFRHCWYPRESPNLFHRLCVMCYTVLCRWLHLFALKTFETIAVHCKKFFLMVSSLDSDWYGDVMYSEADLKLCQKSSRHSLYEWNHSSHSSYWSCAYCLSWWRYMKIRGALNTESNRILLIQWCPKVFKRRYGWKICCSIFVL